MFLGLLDARATGRKPKLFDPPGWKQVSYLASRWVEAIHPEGARGADEFLYHLLFWCSYLLALAVYRVLRFALGVARKIPNHPWRGGGSYGGITVQYSLDIRITSGKGGV